MSTNEGNERRLLEEAQQVVDRAYQRIKVDRQYRRLSQALRKLGVTQIAGPSWCFINEDSLEITFGTVPKHRQNLFIEHMVDLGEVAESRVLERVLVGAPGTHKTDQLQLDLWPDPSEDTYPNDGSRS